MNDGSLDLDPNVLRTALNGLRDALEELRSAMGDLRAILDVLDPDAPNDQIEPLTTATYRRLLEKMNRVETLLAQSGAGRLPSSMH